MQGLKDKVAWVTGSSRGIGAQIAKALAERGARVAVHGRDASALATIHSEIEAAGGRVVSVLGDVTKFADIERMRQQIEQHHAVDAPDTMLPIVQAPEDISVIVVGGAGKHSCWQPTFGGSTRPTRRPIARRDGSPLRRVTDVRQSH